MISASIGLGELLWSLLVIFFIVSYWMMLFTIIVDVVRDRELRGPTKALWFIALLVFPLITLVVYLVTRGDSMTERQLARSAAVQTEFDDYVRRVAGSSPAEQIARGKELLDQGAISQEEFDELKRKALA